MEAALLCHTLRHERKNSTMGRPDLLLNSRIHIVRPPEVFDRVHTFSIEIVYARKILERNSAYNFNFIRVCGINYVDILDVVTSFAWLNMRKMARPRGFCLLPYDSFFADFLAALHSIRV